MNSFEKIKVLIAATEADAVKFHEKGNHAAGTRLRKAYLELKSLASAGRAEVTALKNS
jgi:hypothetical protein